MSGGFDQLVNIKSSTEEIAKKLFKKLLRLKVISKRISCFCIEDSYTSKFIKKSGGIEKFLCGLPIHKTEK